MCHCITPRAEASHFGTVAIDFHRMFHHDSTALTTQASGLGWTSAGLPHIQGVHRNLRTNPVDPSNPLQTLTHTKYCFMHAKFHRYMSGFVPLDAGYTVSVGITRLNVLVLLTLALAGESPTCILHEGTHPVLRAIEVSHAACKAEFWSIPFWSMIQLKCVCVFWKKKCCKRSGNTPSVSELYDGG